MEKGKSVFKKILYWGIGIFLFFLAWPFISSVAGLDGFTSTMFKRIAHVTNQRSRFNEIKAQEGSRVVSVSTPLLELLYIKDGEAHDRTIIDNLVKGEEVVLISDEPAIAFLGRTYLMVRLPGKKIDEYGYISNSIESGGYNVRGYVDARFVSALDDAHGLIPTTQILRPRCNPYVFQLGAGDASNWITFPKDQSVSYTAWDSEHSEYNDVGENFYFENKESDNIASGSSVARFKRGEKFRIRAKTSQIVYIHVY